MSNPVASICEVFVHGSMNKERSPISVCKVSLEPPRSLNVRRTSYL